ncbi:MAG TPA: glycosyltransferase family 39 protein, partial [Thermomicrobiales bacterium]|nr:glycosyltransferase family 39 protein [Thermomicrobiales bacterium]
MSEPRPDTELDSQRSQSAVSDGEFFHPTPPREREEAPAREPARGAEETAPIPTAIEDTEHDVPRVQLVTGAIAASLRNWPVIIILAAFSTAAFIVPTMTQIATTDDWGYTRSVEILLDEGSLKVFPVVAATAVGQILWGALFGAVFGMSLGMMRVSTVVMVALGGVAIYAIMRQLGVTRSRSALGMGVWLFNPLTMSLAYSFMTDAHFASVMLMSLAFYVRGLRPGREDIRFIVVGSFFAGFAFLIRQQGALIPLGVATYLLCTGRLGLSW